MRHDGERGRSENQVNSDPVSVEADKPSEIFEPLEFLHKIKSFWKTRTAILNKVPLYDYSSPQLVQQNFMGAWKFNLAQSTIAALPGTTYASLRGFFLEQNSSKSMAERLFEISHPILIPFVLTATAYIVGRLSLRPEDLTRNKRKRASRIFLYLDGAYGFYPQLLMSCFVPFVGSDPDQLFTWLPFLIISSWTFVLYVFFLPEDLFQALGYRVLGLGDVRPSPPTGKYRVAILVVVPFVAWALTSEFALLTAILALLIRILSARLHAIP